MTVTTMLEMLAVIECARNGGATSDVGKVITFGIVVVVLFCQQSFPINVKLT